VHLQLAGQHNVMNALAATAAALSIEISLESIQDGLEAMTAVKGRLQFHTGLNDSTIIDDTYNANPTSMKAAIDVLSKYSGERYLVIGDMGELGKDEVSMHREIGEYARHKGIDHLYAFGELSSFCVKSFGHGGIFEEDKQRMVTRLKDDLVREAVVLVKGSRQMKMEEVVSVLKGGDS
jgi:UDP-N-acetylmuramoyl-tripeptide--D-alanyl-D-alanine ligase